MAYIIAKGNCDCILNLNVVFKQSFFPLGLKFQTNFKFKHWFVILIGSVLFFSFCLCLVLLYDIHMISQLFVVILFFFINL